MRRSYSSIILIIVVMTVSLAACNQTGHAVPKGYYPYDEQKVESAISQLSFTPELPEYIPFEMVSVVSDIYTKNDKEMLDLSFYTKNNDMLSITFSNSSGAKNWEPPESVKISEDIEGNYKDNQFSKRLSWIREGIMYTLAYRKSIDSSLENKQKVTREKLIEVARSF